jgi:hypothetical protein
MQGLPAALRAEVSQHGTLLLRGACRGRAALQSRGWQGGSEAGVDGWRRLETCHAETHDLDGCVRLRWKRPLCRRTFLVETTADPSNLDEIGSPGRLNSRARVILAVRLLLPSFA